MLADPFIPHPTQRIQIRHMRIARVLFLLFAVLFGVGAGLAALMILNVLYTWNFNLGFVLRVFARHWMVFLIPSLASALFTLLYLMTLHEFWSLTTQALTHHGFLREKQILFAEVTRLRWWSFQRVIILSDGQRRIPLFLDSMPLLVRYQVITRLHQGIPEEHQVHWEAFEQKIYQPLRKQLLMRKEAASPADRLLLPSDAAAELRAAEFRETV